MPENRTIKWGVGIILFLILANIANYYYCNWGLITVKVEDAPLSKVISSIEWQGWVKIYTNLPGDTKVSMWVDHVPLAEAMETLSANVGGRPNGSDRGERGRDGGPGGPNGAPAPAPGAPTVAGGTPPAGDTNAATTTPPPAAPGVVAGGPGAGGAPNGGPGGGGRGGRDRGGFGGGGASWNLAFFVAPTSAQVQAEIQAFQNGTTDDDMKVYTYQTPLQFLTGDVDLPAANPYHQAWPGYNPPAADANPAPAPGPDGQTAPAAPADTTPTVQTYLQAFAESSNIWIMSPGSWAPNVANPPAPNASIIKAVKEFVSGNRGTMVQAIVLRVGRGVRGGGNFRGGGGGGFADMDVMADRMRNAINGLPEDARGPALEQLNQEVQFYQTVKAAPQDQQMKMVRDHMMEKMATMSNSRRSPEKRAQRYARAVSTREGIKGK